MHWIREILYGNAILHVVFKKLLNGDVISHIGLEFCSIDMLSTMSDVENILWEFNPPRWIRETFDGSEILHVGFEHHSMEI